MRQLVTVVTALGLIGTLLMITPSAAARGGHAVAAAVDDGSLIVAYRKGTDSATMVAAEAAVGGHKVASLKTGAHVIKVKPGQAQAAIAALRGKASVRYAEPNYQIHSTAEPNDPLFVNQWALENTWHTDMDVDAPGAWDLTTGSSSIVVGVVDTGIDYTHPDLAANVWSNPGGIGGCAAGTHGYDFAYEDCDPMDDAFNSHGTADSGVIGAVGNNGIGVTGINWQSSMIALKIFDSSGYAYVSDGIRAIDWAIRAKQAGVNIRVLSNSWGYYGTASQALIDEINLAGANGILVVAAAGNDSVSLDEYPFYPCALDAANEICVGASDSMDNLASFSNYGSKVDLAAPGYTIESTFIGGDYNYLSGTSLATPFVSGAGALVLSAEDMTPAALKTRILSTVDVVPGLAGLVRTGGRLDIGRAVAGGGAPPPPDPTPAPTPTPSPTPTASPAPTPAPSKPGAPALSIGPAPQALGSGIHLSWTEPADGGSPITGYQIYRGTSSGHETLLVSVGPSAAYDDTTAVPGTKYFYKTTALNTMGESAKSNEVSAVLPAPPSAPRSLKVSVLSTGGLKLTWSAPSKAGTSPIMGYWIWRGTTAGVEAQLVLVGTARSYIDLTTTAGIKAFYVVAAVNAVGESPWSNEVGGTPTK